MMKNLKKYTLIACSLFTLAACDLEIDITNPGLITEEKPDRPQAGETITYRAQVWVEKNDMEELYCGTTLPDSVGTNVLRHIILPYRFSLPILVHDR